MTIYERRRRWRVLAAALGLGRPHDTASVAEDPFRGQASMEKIYQNKLKYVLMNYDHCTHCGMWDKSSMFLSSIYKNLIFLSSF